MALKAAQSADLLHARGRWERLDSTLQALSPKAILARGYALVFDANGRLVIEVSNLRPGEHVRTQLASGEFVARVEKVKEVDSG